MDFKDTLEYMYNLLPMYQRVGKVAFKKDLTNTIKLCEYLGNPQEKFKSIHIAGTNGKGSSAHMISSILQTSGYKTGLYTSPHLKSFTERIKVNGQEVDEQFVCEFIEKVKFIIGEIQPSFFEITVAMAFDYFARQKVDIAVIEVGLGGRFDSTNVLKPIVSLITSIGLDHTDMLGETLPEIAFEKAGIIKCKTPVVISETQNEIVSVFYEKAKSMEAPIFFADKEYHVEVSQDSTFKIHNNNKVITIIPDLKADYQAKNLPGVLKVVELIAHLGFELDQKSLWEGMQNVIPNTGLFGRWQQLYDKPLTICDTAHNASGVEQLIRQINKIQFQKLHIIWGTVDGKDLPTIFNHLPKNAFYYFCEANIPRALKAEILQAKATESGLKGIVIKNVNDAISLSRENSGEEDLIIIGGSNFLVAEITNLKGEKKATAV